MPPHLVSAGDLTSPVSGDPDTPADSLSAHALGLASPQKGWSVSIIRGSIPGLDFFIPGPGFWPFPGQNGRLGTPADVISLRDIPIKFVRTLRPQGDAARES
jgi:hypothetical protein